MRSAPARPATASACLSSSRRAGAPGWLGDTRRRRLQRCGSGDQPGRIVDASKLDLAAAERATREPVPRDRRRRRRARPARHAAPGRRLVRRAPHAGRVGATVFPNEGYDELVLVRGIWLLLHALHHLLPFHGVAHVAYLPGDSIIGLSKLARVVESFARDLQLQERMTVQIADWLEQELTPRGVGVVLMPSTCA